MTFAIGIVGVITASGADFSWVRRAGGPFGGDITRMAIDGEGNAFITGLFMGQTTFGNDTPDAGNVSRRRLSQNFTASETGFGQGNLIGPTHLKLRTLGLPV